MTLKKASGIAALFLINAAGVAVIAFSVEVFVFWKAPICLLPAAATVAALTLINKKMWPKK